MRLGIYISDDRCSSPRWCWQVTVVKPASNQSKWYKTRWAMFVYFIPEWKLTLIKCMRLEVRLQKAIGDDKRRWLIHYSCWYTTTLLDPYTFFARRRFNLPSGISAAAAAALGKGRYCSATGLDWHSSPRFFHFVVFRLVSSAPCSFSPPRISTWITALIVKTSKTMRWPILVCIHLTNFGKYLMGIFPT